MTFVSAIVRECNLLDLIPVECSCGKAVEKAQSMGIWQENDAYVPQIGDIIMYDWMIVEMVITQDGLIM